MALTSVDLNSIQKLISTAVNQRFEELAIMIQNHVIANMATKDDLARMATKDDLAKMATKDDLARVEVRLERVEALVSSHDSRLDHIESHLADLAVNQRRLVEILAAKRVLTNGEALALASP